MHNVENNLFFVAILCSYITIYNYDNNWLVIWDSFESGKCSDFCLQIVFAVKPFLSKLAVGNCCLPHFVICSYSTKNSFFQT